MLPCSGGIAAQCIESRRSDEAGTMLERPIKTNGERLWDRLMEMARMASADGMTMQIHPGSYRNHNELIFRRYGTDKGADIRH